MTRIASLIGIVSVASVLATGCAPVSFSDSEPLIQTEPPIARNRCEEVFKTQLTDGLGLAETAPPSPAQAAVLSVMDDCTAHELLVADDYYSFGIGRPMSRLQARRLFNGPDRPQRLVELCALAPYNATLACRTVDADI